MWALFDIIAFDADDTLWINEPLYQAVEEKFTRLLSVYDAAQISKALLQNETSNMSLYGYGAKSFALSMIQTAVEVSRGEVRGEQLLQIIEWIKAMLAEEKPLLPGVEQVVSELAQEHTLMVLTKGDLTEQQGKLDGSGLAQYFTHIEIISHKDAQSYRNLLERYQIPPERFLMVGNSLKSDILPVVEINGTAVYIPAQVTWAHEEAESDEGNNKYFQLKEISELPRLLNKLEKE
jgi:putative hydrolase of the HAD superfamily